MFPEPPEKTDGCVELMREPSPRKFDSPTRKKKFRYVNNSVEFANYDPEKFIRIHN